MGSRDTCCNYVEEFDDNGFSSKYITKDAKENMKSEQTFTHNDDGLFTGMTTMTNNKKTSSMSVDIADGKYVRAKAIDSTGKMESYFDSITTNEFGEMTGATERHSNSTVKGSFKSRYNKQFFVGNESKDSTGNVSYRSSVKLNEKNDQEQLTETNISKDSTTTTVTTYKYDGLDEQGNWTQRTTYNDKGKPTKIIKRTIIYADEKK